MRGKDPIETIMDLIAEDESRIDTIYFLMSEENVQKELAKPWISFGSDEASQAPEGVFLEIQSASARLWKFRARARQICARRKSDHARGSCATLERVAGDESRA